ncbi:cation transporter [Acetivibrio straminisolvens]|uniref:cation transporter n=1 Tax=Acetivibrio straminisolvens TaxID=253314 RepID=UPI001FB12486|nr:cation transporter [Acetivibrio straminisolvens]
MGAIIVSWIVFRIVNKKDELDAAYKDKLERTANICVGAAMCLSGAAMLFIALFSPGSKKGNVIPGLVIAVLGVITNTWFWLRYRRLNREKPNAILAVQSRLYCAKAAVDACVTASLTFVAVAPAKPVAWYVDLLGSVIVAFYLIINGVITIRGKNNVMNWKQTP